MTSPRRVGLPSRLGSFALTDLVSSGPFGHVVLADLAGARVVLKVLDPTAPPHAVARFEREAALLASVTSPRVPRLVECGHAAGRHFLAMSHVEGPTLRGHLSGGVLPPRVVAQVVHGLLLALRDVHAAHVVHRDVKPENIILSPEGPVLVDFGIAKRSGEPSTEGDDAALTTKDAVLGTLAYAAPEQGDLPPALPSLDIYACGVVLFECLTGRRPFEAPTAAATLMLKRRREAPSVDSHTTAPLPRALPPLVAAMLARAPDARPPSADAVLHAFAPVAAELAGA